MNPASMKSCAYQYSSFLKLLCINGMGRLTTLVAPILFVLKSWQLQVRETPPSAPSEEKKAGLGPGLKENRLRGGNVLRIPEFPFRFELLQATA